MFRCRTLANLASTLNVARKIDFIIMIESIKILKIDVIWSDFHEKIIMLS